MRILTKGLLATLTGLTLLVVPTSPASAGNHFVGASLTDGSVVFRDTVTTLPWLTTPFPTSPCFAEGNVSSFAGTWEAWTWTDYVVDDHLWSRYVHVTGTYAGDVITILDGTLEMTATDVADDCTGAGPVECSVDATGLAGDGLVTNGTLPLLTTGDTIHFAVANTGFYETFAWGHGCDDYAWADFTVTTLFTTLEVDS